MQFDNKLALAQEIAWALNTTHAIIWTDGDLVYCRMYVSPDINAFCKHKLKPNGIIACIKFRDYEPLKLIWCSIEKYTVNDLLLPKH